MIIKNNYIFICCLLIILWACTPKNENNTQSNPSLFEGSITIQVDHTYFQNKKNKIPKSIIMTALMKKNKVLIKNSSTVDFAVVYDLEKGKKYELITLHNSKHVFISKIKTDQKDSKILFEQLNETRDINGYKCKKYKISIKQKTDKGLLYNEIVFWGTTKYKQKYFLLFNNSALYSNKSIVMPLYIEDTLFLNDIVQRRIKTKLINITTKKLSNDLFTMPENYKVVNMSFTDYKLAELKKIESIFPVLGRFEAMTKEVGKIVGDKKNVKVKPDDILDLEKIKPEYFDKMYRDYYNKM